MGDEALKLQEAVQRASELQITNSIVFMLMVVIIIAIVTVFVRNSGAQASATKAQGDTLTRQLELQSKQLDVFNRLDASLSLQNARNNEYHNNTQKSLITLTGALDSVAGALETTLKNSMAANAALERVEKNGKKMADELHGALAGLGEARQEVKETAAAAKEAQSGVHGLAEFMRTGLMEVHAALDKIAQKVEDLPQIREQLNAAKEQIEQLSRDVRRMDVPRTEGTNPPEPPITPEGD